MQESGNSDFPFNYDFMMKTNTLRGSSDNVHEYPSKLTRIPVPFMVLINCDLIFVRSVFMRLFHEADMNQDASHSIVLMADDIPTLFILQLRRFGSAS